MLYLYYQAKTFGTTPAALLFESDPFKAWTINKLAFDAGVRDEVRRRKNAATESKRRLKWHK